MGNSGPQTRSYSPCADAAEGVPPVEVYVNIYDLCNNEKMVKVGFGLHHSGIELFGYEWSFGGGEVPDGRTGVFAILPKTATPNLRASVLLGTCDLTPDQLHACISDLEDEWPMNSYDILARNCNHFSEAFARRLGFTNFPGWVNRAARLGNAVVPRSLLSCIMQQVVPPNAEEYLPEPPRHIGPALTEPPTMEIPADLSALTARQLQTILFVHGLAWDDCVEKADLVAAVDRLRVTRPT